MKKLLLSLVLLTLASSVFAQGLNARSMSMAGAYNCLARGSEVVRWNPANLGFPTKGELKKMSTPHPLWPKNPFMSIELASVGWSIGNISLNLDLYDQYFTKSYFDTHDMWDDDAKAAIVGAFDNDLRGFSNIQFTGLAVSYKQFAFAVTGFGYSSLDIPQNLVTIPLEGLTTEPLPLDFHGEMIGGMEFALSTSKVLYEWDFFDYFSLGATFKYFLGQAYAKIEQADGTILSNNDSLGVEGSYKAYLALPFDDKGKGGDGVGLDLGAAAMMGDNLTLGMTLTNLIGSINFGEVVEYQGSISLHEPGLNQEEFADFGNYIDSIAVTSDTNFTSGDVVVYKLPKNLILSANYRLNKRVDFEVDYTQGFINTAGGTTTPRISLGAELTYVPFLPLRFGFALGGVQGSTYAAGFGLKLGSFQLDFAMAGQRGLFNGSKGINFAISPRIMF